MRTFRLAALGATGAILTAALLASMAGCGGDDNAPVTPIPPPDAAVSEGSVTVTDSASSDSTPDTSVRVDAAGDSAVAGDSGGASIADTGTLQDVEIQADADGGSAPVGDGGCVTTTPNGSGSVLFAFDEGNITGWGASVEPGSADSGLVTSAGGSATVGRTCPGSLVMSLVFNGYGNEVAEIGFNAPGTWTANFLHIWVKIVTPADVVIADDAGGSDGGAAADVGAVDRAGDARVDADALAQRDADASAAVDASDAGPTDAAATDAFEAGDDSSTAADASAASAYQALNYIGAYAQWNSYGSTANSPAPAIYPTFADGAWHEIVMPLPAQNGAPQFSEAMSKLAIQVAEQMTQPAGGPAQPSGVKVYIDDIWLE